MSLNIGDSSSEVGSILIMPLTDDESSQTSSLHTDESSANSVYSDQEASSSDAFTHICNVCQLTFATELEFKQHYKSEFHLYNMKRNLVGLKPVSVEEFEKRTSDYLLVC